MRATPPNLVVATGIAAVLAASGSAAGADNWLTVEGSARCSVSAGALAAQISAAVAGIRHPDLTLDVELVDAAPGTTALVRLARGSRSLGTKRIEATSCEEAIDAAVAIAALALGGAPPMLPPAPPPQPHAISPDSDLASPEPASTALRRVEPARPDDTALERSRPASAVLAPELADGGVSPSAFEATAAPWRWLWAVGVDRGALAAATPTLNAGVELSFGADELRAMLGYGLPSANERDEASDGFQSSRSDFAALSVHYCRAIDVDGWLALCVGSEARVTRSSRVDARGDQPRIQRERVDPGALAVGGASLVYRDVTWQPRFDVSALVPVLGGMAGAEPPGVRAAIGASLPF